MASPRKGLTESAVAVESVMRSSVSVMTLLSGVSFPNSVEATPATTRFLSSSDPSLAIVADVPMHREVLGLQPFTDTAHQQRHVRALPAAVRVQLVQDEEAKARAVADDLAVELLLPRHEQLEHHESW